MFRSESINRYFHKVGLEKSSASSSGTNSLSTHKSVGSESLGDDLLNLGTPIAGSVDSVIVLESYNSQGNSIVVVEGLSMGGSEFGSAASSKMREYLSTDPRYVHVEAGVPKCACDTSNSVCDQPRKCKRSNPAVQLVALIRFQFLFARGGFVDLFVPSSSVAPEIHELSSDSHYTFELCDDKDDEVDPDVSDWIKEQRKGKVSYEATRRFQETWAAKFPWAECIKGDSGLYDFVRCIVCTEFEARKKILQPK
jgi:hypothetical protein